MTQRGSKGNTPMDRMDGILGFMAWMEGMGWGLSTPMERMDVVMGWRFRLAPE